MKWQKALRWASVNLASLIVIGTTSHYALATPITQNLLPVNMSSPNSYLSQASSSTGSAQYTYQLLAAASMLQNNHVDAANQLLNQLRHAPLSITQRDEFRVVQAGIATASDNPFFGAKVIAKVSNINVFNQTWQLLYWQVAFSTYDRSDNQPSALFALIKFLELTNNNTPQNMAPLWQKLQSLPANSLGSFANSSDPIVQGWGQLTLAVQQNANQPVNLANAIRTWQAKYPNHPANQIIPNNQILSAASSNPEPNQIALLVPMSGQYADMGKAIRDGFMTGYFNAAPGVMKPTIKIYDTNNAAIPALYQQAVTDGAQVVVGPLLKQDVDQLASIGSLAVPTIALNYTDRSISSPQMIEVGLSPQVAAQQIASSAWQHGVSQVLMITANNNGWANNVSRFFTAEFQALGGKVMDSVNVDNNPKTLPQQISQALKINQSQLQIDASKQAFRSRAKKAHRRTDINGIFLLAPPELARQVEPLLKFYFAGNLPVFSTSYVYNGLPDPNRNRDLDGTFFNDIPWILSENPVVANIRQQVSNAWQGNYRANTRLYAVGYDAFTLSLQFSRVVNLPTFGIDGMTGRLYLANQQVIGQLTNAIMRDGYAQALPW